jgi:predicted PurR-regulated permease PerM
MKIKSAWAVQSFLLCFLFNLALGAVIFFMAAKTTEALSSWFSPLAGAANIPEDLRLALNNSGSLIAQIREYLLPVTAGLISAFTFLLWFFVFLAGERQIGRAVEHAGPSREAEAAAHQTGDPDKDIPAGN